jgi:hypothetical protein
VPNTGNERRPYDSLGLVPGALGLIMLALSPVLGFPTSVVLPGIACTLLGGHSAWRLWHQRSK